MLYAVDTFTALGAIIAFAAYAVEADTASAA